MKGTRTFHDVKAVEPGIVKVRHLSCFCNVCTGLDDSGKCENKPKSARKGETVNKSECVKRPARVKRQKREEMHDIAEREKMAGRCARVKRQKKTDKPVSAKREKRNENYASVERQKREDAPVSVERQKTEDKLASVERQKEEDAPASEKQQKRADRFANVKRGVKDPVLSCSTYQELKKITKAMEIEEIPDMDSRTFCNTGKVIDNSSLNLVPNDIPLKPTSQLYPATIYGDGNCLPRAGSVLAYGHENNHLELRKRITIELTKNENLFLNNEVMKKGKNPEGEDDVVKAFAHYSSCYMAERLTKHNIRSVYQREVLQVRKAGTWMGLWQIASLANILNGACR